jgi:formamidase
MARPRIAVVQAVVSVDTEDNLRMMEKVVRGIAKDWGDSVRLVTFGEYAVTGFDPSRLEETAEPIPGPATERLAALARETGYYVCNGSMLERAEDGLYNTALIFGPDGELVHHYRKTHPWCPPVGGECVLPGTEFPVTEIPGLGKVGTMICYDAYFPEVARSLVYNGAEIILWNSMGINPLRDAAIATATTRAVENGCYVVLAAAAGIHVGIGLHGCSRIVDPDGVVISQVGGEAPTILVDVVDAEAARRARDEGTKGMLLPWRHLEQFQHRYPHEAGRKGADR